MPRSRSSEPRDRSRGTSSISATGSCRQRRRKTLPRWSPRSMANRAGNMQRPPESTGIRREPAPVLGLRGLDKGGKKHACTGHLRTAVRGSPWAERTEAPPPVSPLQVVEFVARFPGCFAHLHIVLHPLTDEPVRARFTYAQICPHRKKTAGGVLEKEQLGAEC